jgi:MscS family membrane protein
VEWMSETYFGNPGWRYLAALAVSIVGVLLAKIVSGLVAKKIIAGARDTESQVDDVVASLGAKPIFWILTLAALYAAVRTPVWPQWAVEKIWATFAIAFGIAGAVSVIRLINGLLAAYLARKGDDGDKTLFANFLKTFRAFVTTVVWVIAAIFIISNLGFNVSSILAGLGLGGVALALASKDTFSNVFGSLTILVNGPFRVGEAVSYQGHEGTVETVGLRDTRIRTWSGHLVVVPNSMAPTSVIENISRRPSRRVLFQLALDYATPEAKIEEARTLIRETVDKDDRTLDGPMVHFIEFGQSAKEVQVIYHIDLTSDYLDTRHDINTAISRHLTASGIQLAYPTVTINRAG